MVKPQRYFPWKVAQQFFLGHLLFMLAALCFAGLAVRYFIHTNLAESAESAALIARFDVFLVTVIVLVMVALVLALAFTTQHYARPLGRLIQKARELRRTDSPIGGEELDDDEVTSEEPGEWFDLERALGRLHRDLRLRTEELTREREEISTLIGAVSEAILAVDKSGEPLFYNSQFAILFREPKGAGRPLRLVETFRVPEVLAGYHEVLATGQTKIVRATIRTMSKGGVRHFSISIAPLKSRDDGSVYGAVGVFHDVTELKQAEQIRIEFVGNASHELRTPLTSIKGYVATLRDDIAAGRLQDAAPFIEIVAKNVDRMILLVSDLLDLSALESGAELTKTVVSTREVTELALKALEAKRAARRQEITVMYDTETLIADPRRVEQVLVNLVHNAIKYIPEGQRIQVIWQMDAEATVLRVKDNGPGIPAEHHARLFERFYRVDAGRSRESGGTGLGLSIVKHIMLKHGGAVRIESGRGQGAEFICTFP